MYLISGCTTPYNLLKVLIFAPFLSLNLVGSGQDGHPLPTERLIRPGKPLFHGTPVVFGTVGKRQLDKMTLGPNISGSVGEVSLKETIDLILRIHPDTSEIPILAGKAKTDHF